MANLYPIVFPAQLLAKLVIRTARSYSVPTVMAIAEQQDEWLRYVIRVLEAPTDLQLDVFNLARTSNSIALKQLAAILRAFLMLTPTQKADYIVAFKAAATIAGQGMDATTQDTSWDPGHIPPYYEP